MLLASLTRLFVNAQVLLAQAKPKVKVEGIPDQTVTTIRQFIVVGIISFVVFQLFGMGRAVLAKPLKVFSILLEAAILVLILFSGYVMGTDKALNQGDFFSTVAAAPFVFGHTLWRVVFS